jgi:anti-sigma regulatory factor (Ser/Thr protein kinase)
MRIRFEAAAPELDRLLSILDPVGRGLSGEVPGGTNRAPLAGYAQLLGTTTPDLDQAAARLVEFAVAQGLTERSTFVLRSLFEEAASNVVRYSGLSETESFLLGVRMDEACTRMVFADCGIAFDPTTWDAATGTVTREPGDARPPFGIRLLLRLSHRARYLRLDEMTNVLMLERERE